MENGSTGLPLPPVEPRRALADQVYESLTALIMDHDIAPDARLNIEEIARSLDVSPTPVREALARLESDGLVAKEPLRGYRTAPVLTPAEFDQLFEFRRLVEPWASAEAARRRTDEDIDALLTEIATAPAGADGSDYAAYAALAAHDQRFHTLLMRIAGNDVTLAAFERTRAHLHQFRFSFASSMAVYPALEHRRVAEAVIAGDAERAAAAMREHLVAAHDRITSASSPEPTTPADSEQGTP